MSDLTEAERRDPWTHLLDAKQRVAQAQRHIGLLLDRIEDYQQAIALPLPQLSASMSHSPLLQMDQLRIDVRPAVHHLSGAEKLARADNVEAWVRRSTDAWAAAAVRQVLAANAVYDTQVRLLSRHVSAI